MRSTPSAARSTTSPTTAAPREPRRAALDRWRADIDRLFQGDVTPRPPTSPSRSRRFGLRREDFHAVIDGMEMDLDADLRAPDWATLDLYCDRVASAVGRLSVRIFGIEPKTGDRLAHHLGRALQLTNILRDLDEDAAIGRLYLPREALQHAGIDRRRTRARRRSSPEPRLDEACRRRRGARGRAFRRSRPHHGALPAPRGARAAPDGGGLPPHPRRAARARLGAAARAGAASASCASSARCSATGSS